MTSGYLGCGKDLAEPKLLANRDSYGLHSRSVYVLLELVQYRSGNW